MVWNEKGKGWGARASWFDESGKRHRKSKTWFRTKREAVEWEQQYLSDHADRAPDADNMTVRQLLEAYITSCKLRGREPNTIRGYSHCAERLNRHIGDKPICKLNRILLETVYAQMLAQAVDNGADFREVKPNGRAWDGGFASDTLYAGFPHLYFRAKPEIAANFVRKCAAWRNRK